MSMSQEDIEALMNGAEDLGDTETPEIEDVNIPVEDESNSTDTEDNLDDILAGIDGVTDDEPSSNELNSDVDFNSSNTLEEMIEEAKIPLPVEKEHKVVNQLSEVAEDSEEKASQIFDILSFILDENGESSKKLEELETFTLKQRELLTSLENKFPNISMFKDNLELSQNALDTLTLFKTKIEEQNNKIFEAMEIMQYHDINRQKIERVMAVIKKLTNYLNGIFEDDTGKPEVQIAKHISGDSNETVSEDDLEALIGEFNDS